ncbi:L-serine ammonia-lyase, iron-sulfur-dependent, subunit beta [Cohnella pontilimi]|uniref:L-serine deaminase n=1 Tax=Cohnella pontilimi TaxID=2564100 RepID=A0A4U0FBD2_9BACL|nr:L-serine ammonia-lyase, iron-sulfur-dependent subunit beta [Cohnella pontilimi]TJY42007.1 L-serine ammonia-lyase, iron-sulfur-dependent, subunit beta [Cohnella pontilimi]
MRFKDVFSIIGPAMIGPSSSHTAGAVRIGRAARRLFGRQPAEAVVTLYGSFAETYAGHGTDRAIAGGLLDYDTDDVRLPNALEEAERQGLRISFRTGVGMGPHPNYARIELRDEHGTAEMSGASIGGGNIQVVSINGFDVGCSGMYPTLVVTAADRQGVLASLTRVVSDAGLNIGYMMVDRKARDGEAMTVIEVDARPPETLLQEVRRLPHVTELAVIDLTSGS